MVGGGHLTLGLGHAAVQTVAAADDVGLPGRQQLRHQTANQQAVLLVLQLVQHGVLLTHHVTEAQGVAVRAGVQGLVEGDLALELPLGAKVHEDLIFNASRGVGGEFDLLVGAEGVHGLDEADRADGDQVLLVGGLGVVFLDDMGHQAEIVLHQRVAGLQIAGGGPFQTLPLPGRGERLGK